MEHFSFQWHRNQVLHYVFLTAVTLKQDSICLTELAHNKWDWIYFLGFHCLALKKV